MYNNYTHNVFYYNALFLNRTDDLILIPASWIVDKCVYLDVQGNHNLVFISKLPNSKEDE